MTARPPASRASALNRRGMVALALAGLAFGRAVSANASGGGIVYIVGPVPTMPSADDIIHALQGRLRAFGLDSRVRQVGTTLEFTVSDPHEARAVSLLLTRPGRLSIHAGVEPVAVCGGEPAGQICLPGFDGSGSYRLQAEPAVPVGHLAGAEAVTGQGGQRVIAFQFDDEGTRAFGALTLAQAGQLIAVVLDEVVVTAPRVMTPILGGSAILEAPGLEADPWAAVLGLPPLPGPLTLYEIKQAPAQ